MKCWSNLWFSRINNRKNNPFKLRYSDWDTIVKTSNKNLLKRIEEIKYTNSGMNAIRDNLTFDVLSYNIKDDKLKKILEVKEEIINDEIKNADELKNILLVKQQLKIINSIFGIIKINP